MTVVEDYGAFEAYASAYFFGESGYGYFDACSDVDVHVSQWFVCGAAFGGLSRRALGSAALLLVLFLAGTAVSVLRVTDVSVMKLMKSEEE